MVGPWLSGLCAVESGGEARSLWLHDTEAVRHRIDGFQEGGQTCVVALDLQPAFLKLVDGPPGTGCPVISAVSGADLVLIVAEPTVSGTHDMERVLETAAHFGIPAVVCVNKADLYPQGSAKIERFCREHAIEMLGQIPFDQTVTTAMVQGEAVTAYQPASPAGQSLRALWTEVIARLELLPV